MSKQFRKSYAVTTRTPVTEYKLVEYLVNIYVMWLKKVSAVINVHFMVFEDDIFLCLQIICCAFCSDLKKWEYEGLYNEDVRSEEV